MCDSPFVVRNEVTGELMPFDCGKCPPCKKKRVTQWVFRLQQEERVSSSAYFVTLTYDTLHVPLSRYGFMTLDKSHPRNFMKALRKLEPEKLKYYLAGEYGSLNKRPHYHMILFNVSDVENIGKCWTFGDIHIGQVSGPSIAYTCKYLDKQSQIGKHSRDDRVKEYSTMSKNLGISYLTPQQILYHKRNLDKNYCTTFEGYKVALPKYYRDKILTDGEKYRQRCIIEKSRQENRLLKERKIKLLYGDAMDLDTYEDSEKRYRYKTFYSRQKNKRL